MRLLGENVSERGAPSTVNYSYDTQSRTGDTSCGVLNKGWSGICILHLSYHGMGWRLLSSICVCIRLLDSGQIGAAVVAVVRTEF